MVVILAVRRAEQGSPAPSDFFDRSGNISYFLLNLAVGAILEVSVRFCVIGYFAAHAVRAKNKVRKRLKGLSLHEKGCSGSALLKYVKYAGRCFF